MEPCTCSSAGVARYPGNIGDPSGHDAFQDPFVVLLHANVDRLYAMWQCPPR